MKEQNSTKYLKLPFTFKAEALSEELVYLTKKQWQPHYYKTSYEGEWTSISLYTKAGEEENIFASANSDTALQESPALKECAYFREVISHFNCPLLAVRLLRLGAGSVIKPHCDYRLGYEDDNFRIHVPITTNDQVNFLLDGERLIMLPGECWYTNVNYLHSVSNRGKTDRVHLVIDGERNDWSDELFFSLAPKESYGLREGRQSAETIQRMIEELQQSGTPAAAHLIENLQEELSRLSPD